MKIQYEKIHWINTETYEFTKNDGVYAVLIFFYIIALSYLFGLFVYKSNMNKELVRFFPNKQMYKFLIQLPVTVLELAPIFFILHLKNQPLKSIGINAKRLLRQIILGILFSVPLILIKIPIGTNTLNHYSVFEYIWIFLYQFALIALVEEILFRGFIQTRMHGIIKNKIFSVIIVGIIFGIAHIPFQLIVYTGSIGDFLIQSSISIVFRASIHIYFNYIYERDNNILAPTITHAINNILVVIFR